METTPQKLEMFYEGKAKKLYSTSDPDLVIAYFKDDATAFNGKKKDTIEDKGVMNNRMSELFFTLLEKKGVKTHFVRRLNDREMLCKRLQIIPVETVVRNIVAGSMAKRLGREEGEQLPHPIVEYYYKSDALDDPLIIGEHAIAFGWATAAELKQIDAMALKVNRVLSKISRPARRDPRRFQARIRALPRRGYSRRRNLPRHLPILGQGDAPEARQGSLPPRPRRRRGGLSRDAAAGGKLMADADCARGFELQVRVFVTPRKGILDPQGRAVESSLQSLGFKNVSGVKVGKYITLEVEARTPSEARDEAKKMCEALLANPVIEDFRFEVDGE